MPKLNAVHRLTVHASQLGELLLAESGVAAGDSDAVADGPATGDDPVGWRSRWHRSTLSASRSRVCIVDRTFVDLPQACVCTT